MIDKKDAEYIKQAEKIKFKYRSNGVRIIQAKTDMKADLKYSPDDLDSLMMAVVGAVYHMGKDANTIGGNTAQHIVRRNNGTRRKG